MEDGPVTGPIHTTVEPAVARLRPLIHTVNCDIIVPLEQQIEDLLP